MPSRRPRLQPGASASYASPDALSAPTRFIVTLKSEEGLGIEAAWVSVRLDGSGLLRPEGARDAQRFTFQRTDESGTVAFTWLPGSGAPPAPVRLSASAATNGRLAIRRL